MCCCSFVNLQNMYMYPNHLTLNLLTVVDITVLLQTCENVYVFMCMGKSFYLFKYNLLTINKLCRSCLRFTFCSQSPINDISVIKVTWKCRILIRV